MTDTDQFFTDNSSAGYDHAAHHAFCLYAALTNTDTTNPADQLRAIQRLTTWLTKLQLTAKHQLPQDHDPLQGQPF